MEAMEKRRRRADASTISTTSSRAALVKDERNLDKFDRVFGHVFQGLETLADAPLAIPEEWLQARSPRSC